MDVILLQDLQGYGEAGMNITLDLEEGRKLVHNGYAKPAPVTIQPDDCVQEISCNDS